MFGVLVAAFWDFPYYLCLAFGMYISLRVCRFPDLTVDGSFALGMASLWVGISTTGSALVGGALALITGAVAGCATGGLYLLRPQPLYKLLAGLLVMFAISSISYRMMGTETQGLKEYKDTLLNYFFSSDINCGLFAPFRPCSWLIMVILTVLAGFLLWRFLISRPGKWVRAAGVRSSSVRILGVSDKWFTLVGLAAANSMIALGGWVKGLMTNSVDSLTPGIIIHSLGALLLGEMVADMFNLGDRSINPKHALVSCILGAAVYSLAVAFGTWLLQHILGPSLYEARDQKFAVTLLLFCMILVSRFRTIQHNASEDSSLF